MAALPIGITGKLGDKTPVIFGMAHPDVHQAVSNDSLLHGGQNFVYLFNDTVIKLTYCLATKKLFDDLLNNPCVGLPVINRCYGHVCTWDGQKYYGYQLKLYELIEEADVAYSKRKAVCSAVKSVVKNHMKNRGDPSQAQQWADICQKLQADGVIVQNSLIGCFARLETVLNLANGEEWSLDYENPMNWVQLRDPLNPNDQLIFVHPVSSLPVE